MLCYQLCLRSTAVQPLLGNHRWGRRITDGFSSQVSRSSVRYPDRSDYFADSVSTSPVLNRGSDLYLRSNPQRTVGSSKYDRVRVRSPRIGFQSPCGIIPRTPGTVNWDMSIFKNIGSARLTRALYAATVEGFNASYVNYSGYNSGSNIVVQTAKVDILPIQRLSCRNIQCDRN